MAKTPKPAANATIDQQLDEQLKNTFPASDAYSIGHASAEASADTPIGRKPPLIDMDLVRMLARSSKQRFDRT
jgi:hypothetical protein